MDNPCNIIAFKKQFPNKIDLCWANHDTSYHLNEKCSGYQQEYAKDIKSFFKRHKELFNVVYIYDNWIFSHAGISAKWMSCAGIKTPEEINALFKERPNFFKWVGPNSYGDNPNEGPLWIRPQSLMNNAVKNYNQAVGHSEFHDGPKAMIKDEQKFVFTDTGEHNHLTYIDTKTNEVKFAEITAI
jgi:hypothetical protein